MKRTVLLALAALTMGSTGCHMFSKKKKAPGPVETPNVALDVEKDFMRRWIDKRTADLVAQGSTADAAKRQAESEFKAKFNYTDAARQAK